jgi:hypothetical protein
MPPLDQARALLSSPVTACCGAVTSIMARFRSEPVVNFAHIQIENGLSAGGAVLFQGFRPARPATPWERRAHRQSRSGHSPV